ncbi:MAG TPA: hypothetical protein VFT78_09595 [Hanamia sp.]|nr:hypothetical protein [Hanamia sp.]
MEKQLFEKNPILKLTFDFSLSIIDYCDKLNSIKIYHQYAAVKSRNFKKKDSVAADKHLIEIKIKNEVS